MEAAREASALAQDERLSRLAQQETSAETAWWMGALADWDTLLEKDRATLAVHIRRGIPDALRGTVWQKLTKSHKDMNDPASPKFSELVAQDSKDETSIVNDITRVFPTHPFFRQLNGVGQRSLYAVLKAYSNKDPSVGNKGTGYCQGMGFVAGLCLLYMPDKEAFWLLARLLKKYNLGQIFAPDLAGLRLWLYQLDRLMEVRMPELFAHLREEGLESSIFATKWFQTLFIYSLPMRYACRIFDVFLLEGPLVLFTVSLAILDAAIEMDGLLDKNFEQMMDYLNGVPAVLRPDPGPGEAGEEGEEEEEEGREGVQAAAPAAGAAVAEARISPGQLLERAAAIKLDYAELQGYERTFVRTEEPVAGAFSIW